MTRSSVDVEDTGPPSFEELRVRDCSIKRTLDVIGDRWTLPVLREAFYGARRSSGTACYNACPIANPGSVNGINTCSPKTVMTRSRPWSY